MSEQPRMKIPQSAKGNARMALETRKNLPPSRRGMTAVGLARANQLINEDTISLDDAKEIFSFLSRHEVDLKSKEFRELGWESKAGQAIRGWGGMGWKSRLESFINANDK